MSDAFNVTNLFNSLVDNISNRSDNLTDKMNELASAEGDVNPEDMLALQFEIGQYNAMLEATSSVTKALVDEAKQIAQRAN